MTLTAPPRHGSTHQTSQQGPIGRVVAGSLFVGAAAAVAAVLVVAAGAVEHVVVGAALLGFALGWVILAVGSAQLTDQPQRWALVPAGVLAASGLALLF